MDIPSYLLGKQSGGGGSTNNAFIDGTKTYNYAYGVRSLISSIDNLTLDSSVKNLTNFYQGCSSLTTVPFFDTSNVTNMQYMFQYCASLTSVPLFDTSNVINMQSMFQGCTNLISVPFFDTSNATKMTYMFDACTSLTEIPAFSTSKIIEMEMTFRGCTNLTTIPEFNASRIQYMSSVFQNCPNLSNESLDNILKMCISTTSAYRGTKTLAYLGFTSSNYPAATIQALPHYQDFIDAEWTIGY